MKKNISYILQGLEPSSELKRRVMEQASKLEAGRKTFGNEADNMHIQKENIIMNANNTNEVSKVKRSSSSPNCSIRLLNEKPVNTIKKYILLTYPIRNTFLNTAVLM